mgnify:FL=1
MELNKYLNVQDLEDDYLNSIDMTYYPPIHHVTCLKQLVHLYASYFKRVVCVEYNELW